MAKAVAIDKPGRAERRKLADRYGELWEQVQAHKPIAAEYKEVSHQILSWHKDSPADQSFTETGAAWDIGVSPRQLERKVTNMQKLLDLLGIRKFLKLCKIGVADIDDNVPKDKHPEFMETTQTGQRTLTPVKKEAAA